MSTPNRRPTPRELERLLREQSQEIAEKLSVSPITLGVPCDGEGLRIQACVPSGQEHEIPSELVLSLDGEELEVPIEGVGSYEEHEAF